MRRDIFSAMRAKKAAVQYGHPSKGVQLVIVNGSGAATAARLLAELMRESSKRVAVFTCRGSFVEDIPYTPAYELSPVTIQQALAAARKQRCEVVVMEATGALTRPQVLSTLHINMALATDTSESSQTLLEQSLMYAVVPHGLSTDNLPIAPHQMISVGEAAGAEARITNIKLYRRGTELTLTVDHQTVIELATHLVGQANAIAAAYAAAAGYVLGVSVDIIAEGIARLEDMPGNFQSIESKDSPYQIVVDRANQEPELSQLVDSAKQITKRRLLVVVDTTVDSQALVDVKPQVDRLIGVKGHSPVLTDQATDLSDALAIARRAAKKDDLLLLLGREFAAVTPDETTRAASMIEEKSVQD